MDVGKATELVTVIFARMTKDERRAIIKLLKMVKPKLDIDYPNGFQAPQGSNLILPK